MLTANFADLPNIYSDKYCIYCNDVLMCSYVGYNDVVSKVEKEVKAKRKTKMYIRYRKYDIPTENTYTFTKNKIDNNNFTHEIMIKDDIVKHKNTTNEEHVFYIFGYEEKDIIDCFYNKVYKKLPIPFLKEWSEPIFNSMKTGSINGISVTSLDSYIINCNTMSNVQMHGVIVELNLNSFKNLITTLLSIGTISIGDRREKSQLLSSIGGLDDYLNTFGTTLAKKIQDSFIPKFMPTIDSYDEFTNNYDDSCFAEGKDLMEAQKIAIQAGVNNFNDNNFTLVSGEMGTGKTLIASGITYAHHKKNGFNAIVMCPAHLVEKWKREIEELVPNGKGYIINDIYELLNVEKTLRNKNKKENSYIIVSKNIAKTKYTEHPIPYYKPNEEAYYCPECHQKLTKTIRVNRRQRVVNMTHEDFMSANTMNYQCKNEVIKYNKKNKTNEHVTCNCKLWAPMTKSVKDNCKWIKLGRDGWINCDAIHHIKEGLYNKATNGTKLKPAESSMLSKLMDENNIENEVKISSRYPIAKYIKKKMKGLFSYVIIDEVHEFSGKNDQSQAANNLCSIGAKVLCLTGTLLNGYADSLYYILYRTKAKAMIDDGFEYNDIMDFSRRYGVIRNRENNNGDIRNTTEEKLPGVSPLVFTQYLLENTVFISLDDMSDSLPLYQEIPVEIDMDEDLYAAYNDFSNAITSNIRAFDSDSKKILGAMLQSLSTYPDMPYDCVPVCNPDTGAIIARPRELDRNLRNKERALVDLAKEKVQNGEKVLVYVEWSNRTDCQEKLKEALVAEGLSVSIMTSKNSKAQNREKWIADRSKSGLDVLICNPRLVETGLDLFDFTTIIFYQVGYRISTLRQASRRSWRLGQTKPISVYFLTYRDTVQDQALALMANKLKASTSIEGKFNQEGLEAMSNTEDLLSQIANSVVNGIRHEINASSFNPTGGSKTERVIYHTRKKKSELIETEEIINNTRNAINKIIEKNTENLVKQILRGYKHVICL